MSGQCPATTRYAAPVTGDMFGLQCKFTEGHDGDHCANPGIAGPDIFWPQEDTDVIVRVEGEDEEDHIHKMMNAAMASPGRFVHGA